MQNLPHYSKRIPWARGRSSLKLIVLQKQTIGQVHHAFYGLYLVCLLMYCCQLVLPDSRPPPVSLLPPKAPPISAPFVGILTLTMPQSEPLGPVHLNRFFRSLVNRLLLSPCPTLLLISIASSKVLHIR